MKTAGPERRAEGREGQGEGFAMNLRFEDVFFGQVRKHAPQGRKKKIPYAVVRQAGRGIAGRDILGQVDEMTSAEAFGA